MIEVGSSCSFLLMELCQKQWKERQSLGNQGLVVPATPNYLTSASTCAALSKLLEVEKLVVLLLQSIVAPPQTVEAQRGRENLVGKIHML